MKTKRLLAVLCGLTLTLSSTFAQTADTIYYNGSILTMAGTTPAYVEALAVKDGKIAAVGTVTGTGTAFATDFGLSGSPATWGLTDYTDQGGYIFSLTPMITSGGTAIKTGANTWSYVSNVKVKTGSTTWSNVRAVWTKVNSTTWKQTF
jgi:hypothetical protein